MYSLEQIKKHARTTAVYEFATADADADPNTLEQTYRGFIDVLNGKTVRCCYRQQNDYYVWYIGNDLARESDVRSLLNQHR